MYIGLVKCVLLILSVLIKFDVVFVIQNKTTLFNKKLLYDYMSVNNFGLQNSIQTVNFSFFLVFK